MIAVKMVFGGRGIPNLGAVVSSPTPPTWPRVYTAWHKLIINCVAVEVDVVCLSSTVFVSVYSGGINVTTLDRFK